MWLSISPVSYLRLYMRSFSVRTTGTISTTRGSHFDRSDSWPVIYIPLQPGYTETTTPKCKQEMEATQPRKKPPRKPNVYQAEILVMLEEIQASKEVIMSRFQNSITHRMNIRVVAVRSVDEVKKNWKAVKSDTTQALRNQKKTGGGPKRSHPSMPI